MCCLHRTWFPFLAQMFPDLIFLVCSLPCCCLVANINGIETLLSHEPLLLSNCCHHPLLLCLTFSLAVCNCWSNFYLKCPPSNILINKWQYLALLHQSSGPLTTKGCCDSSVTLWSNLLCPTLVSPCMSLKKKGDAQIDGLIIRFISFQRVKLDEISVYHIHHILVNCMDGSERTIFETFIFSTEVFFMRNKQCCWFYYFELLLYPGVLLIVKKKKGALIHCTIIFIYFTHLTWFNVLMSYEDIYIAFKSAENNLTYFSLLTSPSVY